ncbi:MAG: Beta-galactosidase [Actinomycetia bacterium]|nr:Beta-galactosidase [Actinomycetes bacterium]
MSASGGADIQGLGGSSRYVLSGEFHYFRVPRTAWHDRLQQMRDMGLNAVSIYVPWNWHQPSPGVADFGGTQVPERDLTACLEMISEIGLACVYRPGPFITAEWRGGGIPSWLWENNPEVLARNAAGDVSGAYAGYTAVSYSHPVYAAAAKRWMEAALAVAKPYLASQGGPVINVQLDDETSYWGMLMHPLLVDYNPVLIDPDESGTSRYGRFLLERHGDLDAVNAAHRTNFALPAEIEPPRLLTARSELVRFTDWHDFKLDEINEHIVFLDQVTRDAGIDVPISMLFPYLLPLQAAKFSRFAEKRGLRLHITNEIYMSLFDSASYPESKLGHIVACHEAYHMYREGGIGAPVTMEIQGSNAAYLPPGAMEMLYAVTVARGLRGMNFFMMVGGSNPRGFENHLGSAYDISAPISATGAERPHAKVIRKLARVIEASEPAILAAEPVRDVWCGYYLPYETTALVGHIGDDVAGLAELVRETFTAGEMGTAATPSLQALMALSCVSHGAVDLERVTPGRLAELPQLWVMSSDFMAEPVQRKLLDYARGGGRLVMLPGLPHLADDLTPCTVLADAILPGTELPEFTAMGEVGTPKFSIVRTAGGDCLGVPGTATALPAGDGAVLAWNQDTDEPCAVRYPVGDGSVTVLAFRLQYAPTEEPDHKRFLIELVEHAGSRRATTTSNLHLAAMQLSGPSGGLLCVINPTDLEMATAVTYTGADGAAHTIPAEAPMITFDRKGARLLPIDQPLAGGLRLNYATAELLGRSQDAHETALVFAGSPVELSVSGGPVHLEVLHGARISCRVDGAETVIVAAGDSTELCITVGPAQV